MTEIRKRAFVGLVGLVSAGLFSMGCSSSSSSSDGGGGSTGTPAPAAEPPARRARAGPPAAPARPAPAAGPRPVLRPPANGLIADFMGDGGIEIMGGVSTYGGVDNADVHHYGRCSQHHGERSGRHDAALSSAPCSSSTTASMRARSLESSSTSVDLHWLQHAVLHQRQAARRHEHRHQGHLHARFKCATRRKPPSPLSPRRATVMEPWITTAGGSPSAVLDPSKLTGIQWQFTVPVAAEGGAPGTCMSNIQIKNIKFYH